MVLAICFVNMVHWKPHVAMDTKPAWDQIRSVAGEGVLEDIRRALAGMKEDSPAKAFEFVAFAGPKPEIGRYAGSLGTLVTDVIFDHPVRDAIPNLYYFATAELCETVSERISVSGAGRRLSDSEAGLIWQNVLFSAARKIESLMSLKSREAARHNDSASTTPEDNTPASSAEPDGETRRIITVCGMYLRSAIENFERETSTSYGRYAPFHLGHLAVVDFFAEILADAQMRSELTAGMKEVEGPFLIMQNAGWCLPFSDHCFVCDRPSSIDVDSERLLHNAQGPAITYRDGWTVYAWHGVAVAEHVIVRPQSLTIDEILAEDNIEVRRVMIERMGVSGFLEQAETSELDSNEDGSLYIHRLQGDEPIVFIKLKNKTAEADGSVKHYFLRVPPQIRSVKTAVAWSFGMSEDEYAPTIET